MRARRLEDWRMDAVTTRQKSCRSDGGKWSESHASRLFSGTPLSAILRDRRRLAPLEPFLTIGCEEACGVGHLYRDLQCKVPILHDDVAHIERVTTPLRSVGHDTERAILNDYVFSIPFDGDGDLFVYRPSTYGFSPPVASVAEDHLVLEYEGDATGLQGAKQKFHEDVSEIKEWLGWVANDVESYNGFLDACGPTTPSPTQSRRNILGM